MICFIHLFALVVFFYWSDLRTDCNYVFVHNTGLYQQQWVVVKANPAYSYKVPLLMKATSNDEKPTQGYDLQEISSM